MGALIKRVTWSKLVKLWFLTSTFLVSPQTMHGSMD